MSGTLEVHAYVDGTEVEALATIDSKVYSTPAIINLEPGFYSVVVEHGNLVRWETAQISEGATTRLDFKFPIETVGKFPCFILPLTLGVSLYIVGVKSEGGRR
jgi:hypothetical protein